MMRRWKGVCILGLLLCLAIPAQAADKAVALTFDDGPNGECTRELLQLLEEKQVKATFFLCGYRVQEFPELVEEIAANGHEIGLHGCTHKYLSKLPAAQVEEELQQTRQRIAAAGGHDTLLRPPGGLINDNVINTAKKMETPIIMWSVDPEDWKGGDPARICKKVVENTKPGSILLMHDLCNTSVTAASGIIDQLQGQGYEFLTVSELAAFYGTQLQPGRIYRQFSFYEE